MRGAVVNLQVASSPYTLRAGRSSCQKWRLPAVQNHPTSHLQQHGEALLGAGKFSFPLHHISTQKDRTAELEQPGFNTEGRHNLCLISRYAAIISEPKSLTRNFQMGVPLGNAHETGLQFIQRTSSRYFSENALDWAGGELGVLAATGSEQSSVSHRQHPDPRKTRSSGAGREEGQGVVMEAKLD